MADTSFMKELTIWANPFLAKPAKDYLISATKPHHLIFGEKSEHVLDPGSGDSRLLEADIAFWAARSGNGSLFKKITLDSSLQRRLRPL